jgi:hypothetical protein
MKAENKRIAATEINDKQSVSYLEPIYATNGNLVGYVGGSYDLQKLNQLLTVGPGDRIYILDVNNNIVMTLGNGKLVNSTAVQQAAAQASNTGKTYTSEQGDFVVIGRNSTELAKQQIKLAAVLDTEPILSDIREFRLKVYYAAAAALILVNVLMILYLRRLIVKPLDNMKDVAQQIAAGNYEKRVAPSSPVVAPPPQPAVVAPAPAETVTTGRITQVQNNLILDTIMGSNIAIPNSTGRRPRFARLFENISAISSNPEFFARQLYYFYTDQIRNNDQFVVVGLTGMTPASDRFYMAHAYLRAGGLTLDQANNLTGYRTVLINALRQLVILDGSPYVIDSSNVITRERLGHRIEPLRSELSTLLTRAGYNPSFLSVNATPTDIQNAPLEVVLLAISYVEWRVRNQGASLNFDQWIPQAGVAVQARPAQPPATQTVVAPLTAAPTIDANLVTQLTDQVTDLHTAFDTVQATRNQIGAQLVLARTAVTNRNQAALDAAKNEVTRLIRTLSNYEGTDGAVEEANREINRLLPRTDRRRNTPPYQQLITQATGFGSQVTSLIGQARADQTTVNALVIAEDQNAQRQSAQQEYNQAKQNLDAAIALFRNDVTYCRDQLALATTASRANNFANFTTARDNLNARLGLVRGPANATDQQITLSDLTSLMTALRSANDRLNAVDPSSRTRRVDELNGYTRTINGGAGSFVNTLNGFESDLRRLRTPAAPTFVPPPLSAADRALLRDMPQSGPVYVPQGSPQTPQDNVQVAPSAVVTSATFGQAMPARRDDGGFVGSGSASNPYVIDVPLPGISEPINNIRQFPSPQAGGPPVYIRVQFRPLSSADTNQVSLQSISSSISSAIVTLLGNGRPLDIGYRRNITGMGSYREASSNLTDFAPALRELADRNTALRARLRR